MNLLSYCYLSRIEAFLAIQFCDNQRCRGIFFVKQKKKLSSTLQHHDSTEEIADFSERNLHSLEVCPSAIVISLQVTHWLLTEQGWINLELGVQVHKLVLRFHLCLCVFVRWMMVFPFCVVMFMKLHWFDNTSSCLFCGWYNMDWDLI